MKAMKFSSRQSRVRSEFLLPSTAGPARFHSLKFSLLGVENIQQILKRTTGNLLNSCFLSRERHGITLD